MPSNGFLSENSRPEKILGQGEIHRDLPRLNAEQCWVYVDSCRKYAADLVVAPKNSTQRIPLDVISSPGNPPIPLKIVPAPKSGPGCFPADTPVATHLGPKAIQRVEVDDLVWSYDLASRERVLRRVVKTYQHDYDGDIVSIAIGGEVIEATSNHPFWVVRGEQLDERERPEHVPPTAANAKLPGRWVDAGNLRVGDVLYLMKSGEFAEISQLTVRHGRCTVYNVQVEETHNYAVGVGHVLVHNKPAANAVPPSEAAPLPPGRMSVQEGQLLGGEKFRDFVVPGRSVDEIFSARLMTGSDTLVVTWTESLAQGTLTNRIAQVQNLAGGPGSFRRITGLASDNLEGLIRAGKFDANEAAKLLGQKLGGNWKVSVVQRTGSKPPVYDITAELVGK